MEFLDDQPTHLRIVAEDPRDLERVEGFKTKLSRRGHYGSLISHEAKHRHRLLWFEVLKAAKQLINGGP